MKLTANDLRVLRAMASSKRPFIAAGSATWAAIRRLGPAGLIEWAGKHMSLDRDRAFRLTQAGRKAARRP